MKVDLGTCAVCGAKNSKFVEVCYKCGAPLPWAPNYVAPKSPTPSPASANPAPTPSPKPTPPQSVGNPVAPTSVAPQPAPINPKTEAKTVVYPSTPASVSSVDFPANTPSPSGFNRVPTKLQVPTWAIAAGVLGCVVLGMLLMMVFGRGKENTAAVPVPTTTATALPTETATPLPQATVQGTPAVPAATAVPIVIATPIPGATSVAPATAVTTEPVTPVPNAPVASTTPANTTTTAAPSALHGPPYDEVAAKMEGSNNTEAQKQLYWQGVVGSTVTWSGQITNVELNNGGRITLKCGNQNTKGNVLATLDGSQAASLGNVVVGQRISIEGTLQDHSPLGYTLANCRITSFS